MNDEIQGSLEGFFIFRASTVAASAPARGIGSRRAKLQEEE
jgi:hypothetical protein